MSIWFFWYGALLSKHQNILISEWRKQMKSLRFKTLEEIDQQVLNNVLLEAYALRDKKYYK
jgi:hypothetical protein